MAHQIDSARVVELVEGISQDSKQLASGNLRARSDVQEKARRLCQALETPQETLLKVWLLEVCMECFASKKIT